MKKIIMKVIYLYAGTAYILVVMPFVLLFAACSFVADTLDAERRLS